MAKTSGLGWLIGAAVVVGGVALVASKSSAAPAQTPAPGAPPSWWPAGVPFSKPANWPAGMAWPPAPNSQPPAGWTALPMNTMPLPLPQNPATPPTGPAPCVLDANLPPDFAAQVNTILSMSQQTDPNSYDTLTQLLLMPQPGAPNGYPLAAACIQRRKAAGAPIQAPTT